MSDRERYESRFRTSLARPAEPAIAAGIAAGELPAAHTQLSAAAAIGAVGEALLGPLPPVGERTDPGPVVEGIATLRLRAVVADGT
ncbi:MULTISPECIES: hypothetical protein [Streptomyces]|uniref:hypothetical protein n=1 Tax=Streptomyces TaxID=1883 RepID=UPI002E796617|nr:hypothetical protein [Streptomyces sp. BE133]MEE1811097.1 hypothetical protein [Streptomyces sp. BE133]